MNVQTLITNISTINRIKYTVQHLHGRYNGSAVVSNHNNNVVNAAGLDETYATYLDDKWCDIHDHDDDIDHGSYDDADDDKYF